MPRGGKYRLASVARSMGMPDGWSGAMIDSTAAIVLAGGRSSRLASAGIVPPGGKAGLVLAGTTLLERVCGRVGRVARRIVVVAAPGQELPSLPSAVEVVRDSAPDTGPLAGIADGLRAVGDAAAVESVGVEGGESLGAHEAFELHAPQRLGCLDPAGRDLPKVPLVPPEGREASYDATSDGRDTEGEDAVGDNRLL